MVRPKCPRQINSLPRSTYFKPRGIPVSSLEEVVLTVDEFEAMRLADYEGLYQEQASEKMKISRQTFGRILESAHRKVADVLIHGKAMRIEGGAIAMPEMRQFKCVECGHGWDLPFGTGRPGGCPACGSEDFSRLESERGCNRLRDACFGRTENKNNKEKK